ncbi:MAG: high-potential iron-sulfur protein [Pseudomonadota bacterium]
MSEKTRQGLTRRGLLGVALGAGVGTIVGVRHAQAETLELPKLAVDDPAAKALAYVHDASAVDAAEFPTKQDGASCSNCQLYSGTADAEWGPCSIYPGKLVNANGWCRTWVKKPG